MNRSILLFLFLFAILNTRYGSAEEQLDRTKRGLDFFKFLPSFNIFKKAEKPVTSPPLYPIWKVHKYNGVQLKPVSLAELSKSIIRTTTEPPAPTKSQILPSIEQLKLLLGTTSDAETFDALKELASTRGGLRMVAGFIKANIENAKVLAKASTEPDNESETEKYEYSVPAEDEKISSEESTDAASPMKEVSSSFEVSSDDANSSTKEETLQHPLHLGFNLVKSVFSLKPKIFIPPKIFKLPKTHSKQKFIIQPILNESKSDVNSKFNSSLGSNSHFENSGQSYLEFYGVPSSDNPVLNFTENEASVKFDSNLFKESSSGSANKITSGSFVEEYGLPSVEYGTPKFFNNYQDKFSQQFHVPSNTYGVPQIENVGSVIIPDIPKPHTVYGIPNIENNHLKIENKSQIDTAHKNQIILKPENERIIPFPILPSLPSLPEPESLTKFHPSHLSGKSVFSFTGPVTYKTVSSLKNLKNIVASKFEQPAFSYTQLDQLPLEEGIHLKKTFGQVSSYGDNISSHIFDIDNVPAPSSYKSRRVKPDVKKTKGYNEENSTTISPKHRWVPKSKRKYNN